MGASDCRDAEIGDLLFTSAGGKVSTPTWDEAPEWATHLAMDQDGEWWWFEREPEKKNDNFWGLGGNQGGKAQYAGNGITWDETLQQRPI